MFFIRKAIDDILDNRFLHVVTMLTIALSVMIVSAIGLFFINANDLMNNWKSGVRIMGYLDRSVRDQQIDNLQTRLSQLPGVRGATFIPRETALDDLKQQLKRQESLFENLGTNPLPDAFEILISESVAANPQSMEVLAVQIESLPQISSVEYGQKWIGRFAGILSLFKFTGFAMGSFFFMVTVFITANTIRLALYSRIEELEIMRLVGATDQFIKIPFYITGLIQGAVGGLLGILLLYFSFQLLMANIEQESAFSLLQVRFLSFKTVVQILLGSICIGWLGCLVSIKQFLKY